MRWSQTPSSSFAILVAVTDPELRGAVAGALRADGYRVTEEPDAPQALERLAVDGAADTDLVVSDRWVSASEAAGAGVPVVSLAASAASELDIHEVCAAIRNALDAAPPRAEVPAPQKHILLVEDDTELRRLIGAKLRASGVSVTEAVDGLEAADLFDEPVSGGHPAHARFDLIIADHRMPFVPGLELLAGLRAARCTVPFILITAFAEPRLTADARALGADAVLSKPLSLDELVGLVGRWLA